MFKRILPCTVWLAKYDRQILTSDVLAAVIVTVMLIPQSLAYALLAGMPPETGLYASILPLILYAIFGTSQSLAVGPVAVVSLMTAAAASEVAASGLVTHIEAAMMLALISGILLALIGMLRLGFLANFLSHPVVSGFISASGIIIALSQLKHFLGISANGDTLIELLETLISNVSNTNFYTVSVGSFALLILIWARTGLKSILKSMGWNTFYVNTAVRIAPVFAVILTSLAAYLFRLDQLGVKLMGEIPSGLPSLSLPPLEFTVLQYLLLPALMLSIIGYVESVSVGRTLAARKKQKIDPDQELIGLGAANLGASISGGFPVTGGFSRSIVNYDAGAETPAASFFTAIGIALATILLTQYLAWLPNATLGTTIIIAVLSLVDLKILKTTWNYSRSDFAAVSLTMGMTLIFGVEIGVSTGVLISLFLHLYKTSRPHIAEVGLISGTEHFRNILRHKVKTYNDLLLLRVDSRLYFPNASFIEDEILSTLLKRPTIKHVILQCTGVNEIDISALEVLEVLNERLLEQNIGFHLAEVKGPVMDKLNKTHFCEVLNGKVTLTLYEAVQTLHHGD